MNKNDTLIKFFDADYVGGLGRTFVLLASYQGPPGRFDSDAVIIAEVEGKFLMTPKRVEAEIAQSVINDSGAESGEEMSCDAAVDYIRNFLEGISAEHSEKQHGIRMRGLVRLDERQPLRGLLLLRARGLSDVDLDSIAGHIKAPAVHKLLKRVKASSPTFRFR